MNDRETHEHIRRLYLAENIDDMSEGEAQATYAEIRTVPERAREMLTVMEALAPTDRYFTAFRLLFLVAARQILVPAQRRDAGPNEVMAEITRLANESDAEALKVGTLIVSVMQTMNEDTPYGTGADNPPPKTPRGKPRKPPTA